jgi:hypothetical protein
MNKYRWFQLIWQHLAQPAAITSMLKKFGNHRGGPPPPNSAPHFFFPSISILIYHFFLISSLNFFLPLDWVVFGPPCRLCQVKATPTQFNYKLK